MIQNMRERKIYAADRIFDAIKSKQKLLQHQGFNIIANHSSLSFHLSSSMPLQGLHALQAQHTNLTNKLIKHKL